MQNGTQRVTIIQADFAETLRRVADMGGADLILMSPPYADARTYGAGISWTMADYQRLGDAVKPALRPGGHCLMVLDAPVREWRKGYGTERGFLPWQVMLDWAERVGLRVPDRMAYGRQGVPGHFGLRFRNDWEPLLWFVRVGADPYFDRMAIASKAVLGRYAGKVNIAGRRPEGGFDPHRAMSGPSAEQGLANRGNFWWYGNIGHETQEHEHHAPFCYGFAEDAVRCFCPPDGLICDPFSGSGTTASAALIHGRRFFGGDLLSRPSDGKPWAVVGAERARKSLIKAKLRAALDE